MKSSSTVRLSETSNGTEGAILERQFQEFETELAQESTIMERYLMARKKLGNAGSQQSCRVSRLRSLQPDGGDRDHCEGDFFPLLDVKDYTLVEPAVGEALIHFADANVTGVDGCYRVYVASLP